MLEFKQGYIDSGFNFIKILRERGILLEIDGSAFDKEDKGSILITCGDRDRITDIFSHLREMTQMHTLMLNGGGILLADSCFIRRQIILEDCLDANRIKGITFIKTLSHFPCGKALQRGHTAKDIILMTLEGKRNIIKTLSARIKNLRVLALLHVDWRDSNTPERGLRTYVINLKNYNLIENMDY